MRRGKNMREVTYTCDEERRREIKRDRGMELSKGKLHDFMCNKTR